MRLFLMWPAEPTFCLGSPSLHVIRTLCCFIPEVQLFSIWRLKPLPAGPCPSRRLALTAVLHSSDCLRTILSSTHCVSEASVHSCFWGPFLSHSSTYLACVGCNLLLTLSGTHAFLGEELNYFSPMVLEVCLASVNFRRTCLDSDLQIHIPYSLCSPWGQVCILHPSGC